MPERSALSEEETESEPNDAFPFNLNNFWQLFIPRGNHYVYYL